MRLLRIVRLAVLCAAMIGLARTAKGNVHLTHPQPTPMPVVSPAPAPVESCPMVCQPTKKICISETAKGSKTTVKYRCECKTICLPNCGAGGCCQDGSECGKPREVRRLFKRFVKEEKCETKCVPVDAPMCQPGCATPMK